MKSTNFSAVVFNPNLPMAAGKVIAVCVKPELNPYVPTVILCGSGPKIQSIGILFAKEKGAVPVSFHKAGNKLQALSRDI